MGNLPQRIVSLPAHLDFEVRLLFNHFKTRTRKHHFFKVGLPMFSFMACGVYGLAQLVQGRLDVEDAKKEKEWELTELTTGLTPAGPVPKNKRKRFSIEEELKAYQEKVNINDFKYKPVPRPKEEF